MRIALQNFMLTVLANMYEIIRPYFRPVGLFLFRWASYVTAVILVLLLVLHFVLAPMARGILSIHGYIFESAEASAFTIISTQETHPTILVIHHTASDAEKQLKIVDRSHERRGYDASPLTGSHVAYHFMVGKDGTIVQNRDMYERTMHTKNEEINMESIAIVVAGNFETEDVGREQMKALLSLIKQLDGMYHFTKIIPHEDASPTKCPGENLEKALKDVWRGFTYKEKPKGEVWNITRYYTPVPGQSRYFRKAGYAADFKVNCQGDCFVTADGTDLHDKEPMTIAACPPTMPFGTRLDIEGIGIVTCHDRGGAIKDKRIDVWAGYGEKALTTIATTPGGPLNVRILD